MKHVLFIFSCLAFASLLSAQEPTLAWAKQMGGSRSEDSYAIAVDAAGNVYTAGAFAGTVDFDPGPGSYNLTAATDDLVNGGDIFVSKLDSQGNFLWAKQMGVNNSVYIEALTLDTAGNVYTTGSFKSTVDFDPGPGTFNLTSAGEYDIFVSKLDAQGNFVWAKQMGGYNSDGSISIALDAAGSVYTTGSFHGTADFDPGNGIFNLTSAGESDIFISKLDAQGNFLWAKQVGGGQQNSSSIAVDAAGNVYTTGSFKGTVDFDPGLGTFYLTASAQINNDMFLFKLDAQGNFVWVKQVGGSGYRDTANAIDIALDIAGNVYLTGNFNGTPDFDPGPGTFNLTAAAGSSSNMYISKLDAQGNFLWAKQISSIAAAVSFSIALDAAGNVYTTGLFSGNVDFDPGPGTFYLSSVVGYGGSFISKLDAQGNFLWAGAVAYSLGRSIASDAGGNVYTTGWFNRAVDFDPGPGEFTLTPAGLIDIFVLKLSPKACTPPAFNVQVVADATCGKSDGSLLLTPTSGTAPYQYSMNDGQIYVSGPAAGYTFQHLSPGTYQLRLKDASGCESAIVQQTLGSGCPTPCTPPSFLSDGTIVKAPDCGKSNGFLYVYPTSGTPPYQYSMDGGQTYVSGPAEGYEFAGLSPGVYPLRLKDASGCESVVVRKVVASLNCPLTALPPASSTCPTSPSLLNNSQIIKAATCGKSDGALYLIPTAGTAPFLYSLDGGSTYYWGPESGHGFQEIPAGTYRLRIRDAAGCESQVITREVPSGCNNAPTTAAHTRAVQKEGQATVQVYPNPSKGRFQMQLPKLGTARVQLQVVDARGAVLQQRTLNTQESSVVDVDLTGKAKGLYLIRVVNEKGMQQIKVLIQ